MNYIGGEFFYNDYFLNEQKMSDKYVIILENFHSEQLLDQNVSIIFGQPFIYFDIFKLNDGKMDTKNIEYNVRFGCNLKCL